MHKTCASSMQVGFVDFGDKSTQCELLKGTGLPFGYAGSGPDMLKFTPDGKKLVVAIEGEPTFNEDEEQVAFDLRNPEVRKHHAHAHIIP